MHNKDTIMIEEEGALPKCPNCGIFQNFVGLTHQQSIECQRWRRILQEWETYGKNMKVV
jgi:uncharacterized paraquat-inducible protein A